MMLREFSLNVSAEISWHKLRREGIILCYFDVQVD